ncbi:MAG: hypothetical protein WC179_05205 [Candidatus Cloacimonadaceae bacterium]
MANQWQSNPALSSVVPETSLWDTTQQLFTPSNYYAQGFTPPGLGTNLANMVSGLANVGSNIIGTRTYDPKTGASNTTGLGGPQGLANVGSGLASLYSIYAGMEANKRAEDAWKMQKAEYNRGVQKDKDFATAINKSGLGTYSAGA